MVDEEFQSTRCFLSLCKSSTNRQPLVWWFRALHGSVWRTWSIASTSTGTLCVLPTTWQPASCYTSSFASKSSWISVDSVSREPFWNIFLSAHPMISQVTMVVAKAGKTPFTFILRLYLYDILYSAQRDVVFTLLFEQDCHGFKLSPNLQDICYRKAE